MCYAMVNKTDDLEKANYLMNISLQYFLKIQIQGLPTHLISS